jgi:hypothetical protein
MRRNCHFGVMKIFISSLIAGYEDMRAAVAAAIRSLGHEPVTAETFDAGLVSPRVAFRECERPTSSC